MRARLQRRLFVWFGATIVITTLVVGFVGRLVDGGEAGNPEWKNWRAFAQLQFEEVWDDVEARRTLAKRVAQQLDYGVLLIDEGTGARERHGAECRWTFLRFDVEQAGSRVGRVEMCRTDASAHPARGITVLITALLVLWAAMGLLARRLSRPLHRVAEVARAIGVGDLDARVELGRHAYGEAGRLAESVNDMAARIRPRGRDR
jgi:methyl-accepting chemotaxis protein